MCAVKYNKKIIGTTCNNNINNIINHTKPNCNKIQVDSHSNSSLYQRWNYFLKYFNILNALWVKGVNK